MPDTDRLAARLAAVEHALTDGDHGLDDLPDAAALADRVDDVEERVGALESDLAELEAAVRALRGYVGNLDAVNEAVERRADAALAQATIGDAELAGIDAAEGWRDAAAPAASRDHDRANGDESVATRDNGRANGDESVPKRDEPAPGQDEAAPDRDDVVPTSDDRSTDRGRASEASPDPGPGIPDYSADASTAASHEPNASKTEPQSVADQTGPSEPPGSGEQSRPPTGSTPQRRRIGEEWSGDRAERWLERHDADTGRAGDGRSERVDEPEQSDRADERRRDADPSLLDRFREVF